MRKDVYIELYKEVCTDLSTELRNDDDFNEDVLAVKVKGAINEIIAIRGYVRAGYTEEMITADLWNYQSNIMNIARYDYNMIGAEGETSHTESNITRDFVSRNTLFSGVIPLAII